ncbi:MAG TPA: sigma-70 family RNA polymerase sigma factor [Candidatus Corynebacterium avicola]|uniref:Sigma-70 family RNA polymerase sigma factor n=1 Tax=Candidatus Corynebacterium avicola TaxID=2838527 RepID=A0A9D1RR21_9CORY|nr:sigma-70 family RNA polymerase sigma factor [Candidatus Corynebacterium avicola]
MSSGAAAGAAAVLGGIGPDARARLLATLTRRFGDLDLAEDSLQDAFAQALDTWPESGVPDSPEAWLTTTAKRKALDVIRRDATAARKLAELHIEQGGGTPDAAPDTVLTTGATVTDDQLALVFACAHPALKPRDRVALTLRFVGGLSTEDVAHLLLIPVPTMQQRIVRAKKKISTLGIRFTVPQPEDLPERLAAVLRVIYLIFTDGSARRTGEQHVRDDLTDEAVRLARVVHGLLGRRPECSAEVTGLLALLVLTQARRSSRVDDQGRPVPLKDQDRGRWDADLIAEGIALAETAAGTEGAGTYAVQAAIAAVHAEARTYEETDWEQIAVLYGMLLRFESGPVVRLAAAVATGRALGPERGLAALDALVAGNADSPDGADGEVLQGFRPFHLARAVTLEELGRPEDADTEYRRALELPGNEGEDAFLTETLAGLDAPD